jgi:glycosyltransferase involved in cell wall biosynthesis
MVKRKRIGLFFESYATLPAFVIYVENIIRTLSLAQDIERPQLIILHLPDSPIHEIKEINYPHIEFYQLPNIYRNIFKRALNKITRSLGCKNIIPFFDKEFPKDLDCIFPYNMRPECDYIKHKIIWKPDFQEIHLPIFFSKTELKQDRQFTDYLADNPYHLVLSSEDAKRDYLSIYPNYQNTIHLWKFTSYLPETSNINFRTLANKFNINSNYFIVANQFWPHKNHLLVLKALKRCFEANCDFKILFTGKQQSNRDPELFEKLQHYISVNKLNNHVIFTGFIAREEQVVLMKNAMAVIQPSLFEGWSTVIEDCKALNQFVIASNISVNKEQIKDNAIFFDPYNFVDLSTKLMEFNKNCPVKKTANYNEEIKKFMKQLLETFNAN